jgi:hypothetical protein
VGQGCQRLERRGQRNGSGGRGRVTGLRAGSEAGPEGFPPGLLLIFLSFAFSFSDFWFIS